MSLEIRKFGFSLRISGRLDGAREVTEVRCHCLGILRPGEAQVYPQASLHGQKVGEPGLVPGSPCLAPMPLTAGPLCRSPGSFGWGLSDSKEALQLGGEQPSGPTSPS